MLPLMRSLRVTNRIELPPAEEVHLWRFALDRPHTFVTATASLLSTDELERADRAGGDVRRRRILSRGALRTALAAYLGVAPASLVFTYDRCGKPQLAGPVKAARDIRFSVTRSGDCCFVAVARTDVGVDVERLEWRPDLDALAARYFAPEEALSISRVDGDSKVRAFFRYWTCKEALVKAMGGGLATRRLDRLVIGGDVDEPFLAASAYGDRRAWGLAAPALDEPWIVAVAVRRGAGATGDSIRCRRIETGPFGGDAGREVQGAVDGAGARLDIDALGSRGIRREWG
jgi:4'-phosphopantetheinyl transferase